MSKEHCMYIVTLSIRTSHLSVTIGVVGWILVDADSNYDTHTAASS